MVDIVSLSSSTWLLTPHSSLSYWTIIIIGEWAKNIRCNYNLKTKKWAKNIRCNCDLKTKNKIKINFEVYNYFHV